MSVQPFIRPTVLNTNPPPRRLNLTQFIQTVFVGISGLPGELVRPMWQVEPPKQPDINVDWMGIGIERSTPDANSFIGVNDAGAVLSQRHELLEIKCHIYGPNALETADLIRDGFQIPQNLEAMKTANMGFVEIGPILRMPDLFGERWIDRFIMSTFLRREIQRVYPILTLVSANGLIYVPDIETNYTLPWNAGP